MRGIISLFALVLFVLPAFSADAADRYTVAGSGASETITEHTICREVTNDNAASIMVPTKTKPEWCSFIDNTPSNVVLAACSGGSCTPNSFTQVANLPENSDGLSGVPLQDGRVLFCGGYTGAYTNRCDIYDPIADSFTQVANLPENRRNFPGVPLQDGRVLFCGGLVNSSTTTNRCDIYDPIVDNFTQVANVPESKYAHTGVPLQDGRALFCGGTGPTNRCDIYDPIADNFTRVANLPESKTMLSGVPLQDGRILFCGGGLPGFAGPTNRCDIYDPIADNFTQVANLPESKYAHAGVPLQDGRILFCGGGLPGFGGTLTNRCDIYDPIADNFTQVANLPESKRYSSGVPLQDGRALFCGGMLEDHASTNRCDVYATNCPASGGGTCP